MYDKIISLPGQLNYQMNEKGNNFSEGEKQRIALVRAIVKNPDLIIMDEVTANLDRELSQQINQMIERQFEHKTIIRITHSPDPDSQYWTETTISNIDSNVSKEE